VSRASCSRAWQAEAALDRRISAEDRASFERHVQTCETCARELDELLRLKQLGKQLPWPKAEPLQRRRQRNELLRRAHAGETISDARFAWRWVVVPVVLCLLALGVVAQRKLRVEAPVVPEAAVVYEVRADAGSAWSKLAGGDAVRLALEEGALAIHVSKLKSGQSFSVQLPDGELEVRGTRFTVQAGVTRTDRVTVSEGRVALRVRGRPEVLLGAGDTWQQTADAAVSALPSAAGPSSAAAVASSPARAGAAPPRVPASAAASPVAPERAAEPSPASDFAIAMASFSRGDFATAEQLFQRFEARHPRSSQVEDSLFLRALARLRRGDERGARALAAEYLRRYPSGFRSAEAARLVNVP
jgi:TolA-binding protein